MPVKITLFRLTQEALANSYRHARGARQAVRVWSDGAVICLEVADTGRGFDQQSISPGTQHLGLAGMRERVQVLGGTFEVESAPGAGTRIRARVPQEVSDE